MLLAADFAVEYADARRDPPPRRAGRPGRRPAVPRRHDVDDVHAPCAHLATRLAPATRTAAPCAHRDRTRCPGRGGRTPAASVAGDGGDRRAGDPGGADRPRDEDAQAARAARGRQPTRPKIDPFTVGEPWRRHVSSALSTQRRFDEIVQRRGRRPAARPVDEHRRAGASRRRRAVRHRQARRRARPRHRRGSTPASVKRQLAAATDDDSRAALQSQLDAAERMRATRDETDQQLKTMNLRLGELVAQAAEVSVGGGAADASSARRSTTSSARWRRCAWRSPTSMRAPPAGAARPDGHHDVSNEPENSLATATLPIAEVPPVPEMPRNSLLRNNVIVASGTAMSRLTGLIRVYAFARFVGQAAIADAYNSANGSPNAIYELLLGGVLSATLDPGLHQAGRGQRRRGHLGGLHRGDDRRQRADAGRSHRRPGDLPPVLRQRRPATPTCTAPPAPRSPGSSSSRSSSTASSPWPPRCSTPTAGSSPRRGRRCCRTW